MTPEGQRLLELPSTANLCAEHIGTLNSKSVTIGNAVDVSIERDGVNTRSLGGSTAVSALKTA